MTVFTMGQYLLDDIVAYDIKIEIERWLVREWRAQHAGFDSQQSYNYILTILIHNKCNMTINNVL